jgi:hypothetical protein
MLSEAVEDMCMSRFYVDLRDKFPLVQMVGVLLLRWSMFADRFNGDAMGQASVLVEHLLQCILLVVSHIALAVHTGQ